MIRQIELDFCCLRRLTALNGGVHHTESLPIDLREDSLAPDSMTMLALSIPLDIRVMIKEAARVEKRSESSFATHHLQSAAELVLNDTRSQKRRTAVEMQPCTERFIDSQPLDETLHGYDRDLTTKKNVAIKIILFYVQSPKSGQGSDPKKNTLEIPEQIRLLHLSARQRNSNFRLVILTTEDTDLSHLDFDFERVNHVIDTRALMRERNRVQLQYVEAHADLKIPFVFLDTDILLNVDPLMLFEESYDIGLTWRKNKDMPINGGVIMVSNRNPEASKTFYRNLYENQINDPLRLAHWFGEQVSLAKIIDLKPCVLERTERLTKQGVNYRLFPCETHNHTPHRLGVFDRNRILSPVLIHFKGSTARFMREFWKYHLDDHSSCIAFRHLRLIGLRLRLRLERTISKAMR
ncbi:MAG: hypothetical protein RL346_1926 [Verrucomicrobiota bacterium]|jgi:uncharacterized protein (DUF1778 family)